MANSNQGSVYSGSGDPNLRVSAPGGSSYLDVDNGDVWTRPSSAQPGSSDWSLKDSGGSGGLPAATAGQVEEGTDNAVAATPLSLQDARTAQVAGANVIYVSKEAAATDDRTGLSKYDYVKPFATVKAAVASANNGDTIFIGAGSFLEDPKIVITKNLNFIGCGASKTSLTAVATASAGADFRFFSIEAPVAVQFSELTIAMDESEDTSSHATDVIVTDASAGAATITLTNCNGRGLIDIIRLWSNGSLCIINNCDFQCGWDSLTIAPDGYGKGTAYVYNSRFYASGLYTLVSRNILVDNGSAKFFGCSFVTSVALANDPLTQNQVIGSFGAGEPVGPISVDVEFFGCTFTQMAQAGSSGIGRVFAVDSYGGPISLTVTGGSAQIFNPSFNESGLVHLWQPTNNTVSIAALEANGKLLSNSSYSPSETAVNFLASKLNAPLLPTSASGLPVGTIWNDSGTLKIVQP